MRKNIPPQQLHLPVLLDDVLEVLSPRPCETYLDLTAGYGGHASAVIARTGAPDQAVLVDRDENAIRELSGLAEQGTRVLHQDFASAAMNFIENKQQFDLVLVDLGVSSPQLDNASRGFSFQHDGPLDMRMDARMERTAADMVNQTPESELINIIETYGEERRAQARRIARAIIAARPYSGTKQLADAILSVHRGPWQRTHPATRTFQALRIALNDELGQVQRMLDCLPELLTSGGRAAVISFHSLEDRLVKRQFAEWDRAGYEAVVQLLTKKAIDGAINDVHNPRARSAKLRAVVKK